MLTKILSNDVEKTDKLKFRNWFWIFVAVIPMGLVFAIIVLITLKMDQKENK